MFETLQPAALQAWVLALVAVHLKLLSNSFFQGIGRTRARVVTTPEDAIAFGHGKLKVAEDPPLAERATWAWENDLENLPLFLFLSLGYVLTGGEAETCRLAFGIYLLSRVVHAVALARALQPLRSLSFMIGLIVLFFLSGSLLVRAL